MSGVHTATAGASAKFQGRKISWKFKVQNQIKHGGLGGGCKANSAFHDCHKTVWRNSTFVETGEAQDHGKQGCIDDQGQQHKASSPQHHLSLDNLHLDADTMLMPAAWMESFASDYCCVEAWLIHELDKRA